MLINGVSVSGGDLLAYFFRKRGLGKLIGTTTMGAVRHDRGESGFAMSTMVPALKQNHMISTQSRIAGSAGRHISFDNCLLQAWSFTVLP
jgi:hypothetical protein